jgi:hypothetical protein
MLCLLLLKETDHHGSMGLARMTQYPTKLTDVERNQMPGRDKREAREWHV